MKQRPAIDNQTAIGNLELVSIDETSFALKISGNWSRQATVKPIDQILSRLKSHPPQKIIIAAGTLTAWDSRLPSQLLKIMDYCAANNIQVDSGQLPDGIKSLLKLALAVPERASTRRGGSRFSWLSNIGKSIIDMQKDMYGLIVFIGEVALAAGALLTGKARFRMIDLLTFIQDAGPNGFPIVSLISLLVGLILAFVAALQLAMVDAKIYIADLVALGIVREMGPLMTAIIASGRTGAAYATQLGTMNLNNEIDALKTMGISAMEFLVLPRMLALVLMLPLLTLCADLLGILGGAMVSSTAFDVTFIQYYQQIKKAVDLVDFGVGIFKSVVFACLIAIAGCMRGMQCGRSASAVGEAATAAVVDSIVYIVVADSLITLIYNRLDL